ncbi:MAG: phosphate transport regulator [Thermomicrobiales bacterium]|nr:MAG: phosphate transport regulator [Thermomicrobiales bacterium]
MVLARFLPRDERFFDLFRDAAQNATEVAALLAEVLTDPPEAERKVRRLRDLEHRGDELTHQVFNALNSTFVTPLDREDIQALAAELDDFVDDVEEVGRRWWLFRCGPAPASAELLSKIIREQAEVVARAVPLLEDSRRSGELRQHIVEIHRLENEADEALDRALGVQFEGVTDIQSLILAIRWGELHHLLEDATDRAEDIANTLEGIMLKHG